MQVIEFIIIAFIFIINKFMAMKQIITIKVVIIIVHLSLFQQTNLKANAIIRIVTIALHIRRFIVPIVIAVINAKHQLLANQVVYSLIIITAITIIVKVIIKPIIVVITTTIIMFFNFKIASSHIQCSIINKINSQAIHQQKVNC